MTRTRTANGKFAHEAVKKPKKKQPGKGGQRARRAMLDALELHAGVRPHRSESHDRGGERAREAAKRMWHMRQLGPEPDWYALLKAQVAQGDAHAVWRWSQLYEV